MSADEKSVGETDRPSPEKADSATARSDSPVADAGNGVAEDTAAADPEGMGDVTEAEVVQLEPAEEASPEQRRMRELETAAATAAQQASDAQARLRAVSKAYQDLQAEMKSFRERQEARAKDDGERQAFALAKAFFDPVMNLKRSLQSADASVEEGFMNGLKLVHQQFMEAMNKLGLEEVAGEGAAFDPNVHEALAVTPVNDKAQDGVILTVHAVGFAVKGRVLQPAQVVVGKYQETEGGEA